MAKYSSFISEHTAEYIILPPLINAIEKKYSSVLPLFYWSSREGGSHGRDSLRFNNYKVIAVYPRRPKVLKVNSETICLTFNDILFDALKNSILSAFPFWPECLL